jgi:hypothetical protein
MLILCAFASSHSLAHFFSDVDVGNRRGEKCQINLCETRFVLSFSKKDHQPPRVSLSSFSPLTFFRLFSDPTPPIKEILSDVNISIRGKERVFVVVFFFMHLLLWCFSEKKEACREGMKRTRIFSRGIQSFIGFQLSDDLRLNPFT